MKTCSLHLRTAKCSCMSARVEYLQDLFGIIPCDRFVSSLIFIYSMIYLFLYSFTYIYFIHLLKPSATLFYHSNCSNSGHCKLLHFVPMSSDILFSSCVHAFAFFFKKTYSYTLILQDVPGLPCM